MAQCGCGVWRGRDRPLTIYSNLWNPGYNIYRVINMNACIDPFGINTEASPVETVADSFLSWVRSAFQSDSYGQNWIQFYADNIGMFLRNAVIYNYPGGMVQFYQDQPSPLIPQTSLGIATRTASDYSLRLEPTELPASVIALSSSLPTYNPIYGWMDAGQQLQDGSTYWVLIADELNRLIWIAANGIGHDPNILTSQNAVDPTLINPSREYDSADMSTIIGE